jgi:hypothetical protein
LNYTSFKSTHFSALSLEEEYSIKEASLITSFKASLKTESETSTFWPPIDPEIKEQTTEFVSRSVWDFFKDVIDVNLSPQIKTELDKTESRAVEVLGKNVRKNQRRSEVKAAQVETKATKATTKSVEERKINKENKETSLDNQEEEEDSALAPETTTLPPCSLFLPIDFERGLKCRNDTIIWTRYHCFENI